MKAYTYAIEGRAADGQTWLHCGVLECEPGEFANLPRRAMLLAFNALTAGKAEYGHPGKGCAGPYSMTKMTIEEAT